LAYQMTAERDNEKAQSRNDSVFITVAKARVWASEGWQVVVTDDTTGRTFSPAEFEDLCSLDAKSLDARKSRHAATENVEEQHGDSEKSDEQHGDSHQSDGAGEKWIGHPLLPDAGAGTVPADEADIVAERQKFFGDRLNQGGVAAAGDVAAADRTIEKYIANMGKPNLVVKEHDATG
jgi:hypothetical protein